jgi:hypothetical protein
VAKLLMLVQRLHCVVVGSISYVPEVQAASFRVPNILLH